MAESGVSMGAIVSLFILAIVGLVLVPAIADNVWETTNTMPGTEVVDVTGNRINLHALAGVNLSDFDLGTITLGQDNIRGVSSVTHNNGTVLIQDTDWEFVTRLSGTVRLLNSSTNTAWDYDGVNQFNQTNWTYTFGDSYVENANARTLLNLIPLFFIIGLVLLVAAVALRKFTDKL